MEWTESRSVVRPKEIDLDCSPTTAYFHRDIREEEVVDPDTKEKRTEYIYEEAIMPKTEYASQLAYRNQANIDFIAMMTDVELEDN